MPGDRDRKTDIAGASKASEAPAAAGGPAGATGGRDFIRHHVRADLASGRTSVVATRFPPEPNGQLHIGHAKNIVLNFGLAREFGGRCHLRFDDTNPAAESVEFVESQREDIRWLGFDWGDHLYFASDYFPKLYEHALELIRQGRAFVCDLSSAEIEARRGTLTEPGVESPHRTRSVEENLDLFQRMRAGEFAPGERVLRAKIDMASPVLPNRDPILYRIVEARHHRTGSEWPIYPLYDFAHSLSDAIEGISHSICTMEFVDRPPALRMDSRSGQGARAPPSTDRVRGLNLTHTVLSKRKLRPLVEGGHVAGWDDPRMPTLAGFRRRGVPASAIRTFCEEIGVTRSESTIQLSRLEASIRADLNETSLRTLGVLDPVKLVVENYPEHDTEELEAVNNPQDASAGTRKVPFSRELWIERDDFLADPPSKFHRLSPGKEVRLRYAYLVTCTGFDADEAGHVTEVRCRYDPDTRGGDAPDGRKVRGTIHWVSARHAVRAEARLYDVLFQSEAPLGQPDLLADLQPGSLQVIEGAQVEPALASAPPGSRYQLERLGYFCVDPDSTPERPVLNRTVTLRDSWAKIAGRD